MPPWSGLRRLGKSRLLRTSYFWLVFVPLLANLFLKIGPEIHIPLWKNEIVLTLTLPFSWQMFYFSSVGFAIASAIYSLACPNIVSSYEKYSEFADEGKGADQIRAALWHVLKSKGRTEALDIAHDFLARYCGAEPTVMDDESPGPLSYDPGIIIDVLDSEDMDQDKLPAAFWQVRNYADVQSPILRRVCWISYILAFLLILIVLFQNFLYVVRLAIH